MPSKRAKVSSCGNLLHTVVDAGRRQMQKWACSSQKRVCAGISVAVVVLLLWLAQQFLQLDTSLLFETRSLPAAGAVPLGAYDSLFTRSRVYFFNEPTSLHFDRETVTLGHQLLVYPQVLEVLRNNKPHQLDDDMLEEGAKSASHKDIMTSYREGKQGVLTTVQHTVLTAGSSCQVTINKPVLLLLVVGETFGENFSRVVVQGLLAARTVERELGVAPGSFQVILHDPRDKKIIQAFSALDPDAFRKNTNMCDSIRGSYNETTYSVSFADPDQDGHRRSFVYSAEAMREQCRQLLPRMPFQQHIGRNASKYANEVYSYLELLGLGDVSSSSVYGAKTVCAQQLYMLSPETLAHWQTGNQEVVHSPGLMNFVQTVQKNAGAITLATPPSLRSGVVPSAVAGTTGKGAAPFQAALRAEMPTITVAARSCFPMAAPGGICCNCKRVLLNEQEIVSQLKDRFEPLGYRVQYVELSTFSAQETVRLLANTTILLSAHGSALWNAVVLPVNAAVIELYPFSYYEPKYQSFSRMTGKLYFKHRLTRQTMNGHHGHYIADVAEVSDLVYVAHRVLTNMEFLRKYSSRSKR